MNLVQQFPDTSEKIRAKIKMRQRIYRAANAWQPSVYTENKEVIQYYEGEFRRWHIKLFLIVAASLGTVYFALLKSASIFNWISA